MKTLNPIHIYNTYDKVEGLKPCRKKPIVVFAKQIDEPFLVKSMEGNHAGKAGDYLMQGVDGELYICDKDVFKKTYDFIK